MDLAEQAYKAFKAFWYRQAWTDNVFMSDRWLEHHKAYFNREP